MSAPDRTVVAGAGSIGCFVGGLLAGGGRSVTLLARERMVQAIRERVLRVTDYAGLDLRLPPGRPDVADDPQILRAATIVLVTVKGGDTASMAKTIAEHAPADAIVVSLQNGVANADILRAALPGRIVVAGMVPFNVVQLDGSRFHRGTSGAMIIGNNVPGLDARLRVPHLAIETSADMVGVQWGKLLFNLNNALNALSGLPLREQLETRAWRRVLAAQIAEALPLLGKAGIKPVMAGPLPAALVPHVLRLPTFLFRRVAARTLQIDPQARSSMWEDFERDRATEIDALQGTIVALAKKFGRDAPINRRVAVLVREAEAKREGSPKLQPSDVLS